SPHSLLAGNGPAAAAATALLRGRGPGDGRVEHSPPDKRDPPCLRASSPVGGAGRAGVLQPEPHLHRPAAPGHLPGPVRLPRPDDRPPDTFPPGPDRVLPRRARRPGPASHGGYPVRAVLGGTGLERQVGYLRHARRP